MPLGPNVRLGGPVAAAGGALLGLLLAGVDPAAAVGPYWHVDTFNAANLSSMTGNRAMWSGVPGGTPGYASAPGYGNGWDDRLYWRTTVAVPTLSTQVRLRFDFNHDLPSGADFFRIEREVMGAWVVLGQVSGSNKNGMGQFITPATFDQVWTVPPGQYGGPHGDQVVLRLRVLTNASASDQDGGYNTSGAVQVDNVVVELNGTAVSSADFDPAGSNGGWTPFDRQAAADYVRDNVLGGAWANANLWMTQAPLDPTHVARDGDPLVPDLPMPYALTWFVVVDTFPDRNWSKPCQWVAVRADLGAHSGPISKQMPGAIHAGNGSGPRVDMDCAGVTPFPCPSLETPPSVGGAAPGAENPCRHAVLISGGVDRGLDRDYYTENLMAVYQKLRSLGFAKANLHAFYADGESRDLDDLDGDGDHDTGNDLEGEANLAAIRDRIRSLCAELDPRQDVLFIYTTDHGNAGGFLHLWDFDGDDSYDDDEKYPRSDLGFDTRYCRVCRLFVVMDQCFSGDFISNLTDEAHANTAIYTAADHQETVLREYMNRWEDLDPTTQTMNELHAAASLAVFWTDPQMGEGTPGIGDSFLGDCCALENCYASEVTPFCPDDVTKDAVLVVCNLLDEEHSYDVAFAGDPADADAGCTEAGPVLFTPLDPLPLVIPPRACARLRVRIDRPAGLDALNETACYTATVTNLERGNNLICHGSVKDRRDLCPEWVLAEDYQAIPQDQLRTFTIRLTNPAPTPSENAAAMSAVPYRFEVVPAEVDNVPEDAVGLNGGAPGAPVTGTFALPSPGGSLELPITVQYAQPDTEFFHVLRFLADVDGDATMEVLATMGLRNLGVATVSVTPRVAGAPGDPGLRVSPNPVRGEVALIFEAPGPEAGACRLEVIDLQGRRVRRLLGGAPIAQGPQRVVWDATDEDGRRVPDGVYLVRLTTARGVRQAKAGVMR